MKRVVVTGMGALTPLGNNVMDFWKNLEVGISGAGKITRFDATNFRTKIACELKDFKPSDFLDRNAIKRSDLYTQYALVASNQAIADAGLDIAKESSPFNIGVIWGTGEGGMDTFETEVAEYAQGNGTPRFSPFFVPKLIANMAPGLISIQHGFMGINYTTVSACATSNNSIMDAFNYIRWGKAKVIVTGGSEAPITPASVGGFCSMKAMSIRNEDPKHASRPFDADRDGFVIGEGAGALVLEELEHALSRGANIYAEVLGAAMTADAYHITTPRPDGMGAKEAMRQALEDANVNIADLDFLNVHGTSTPVGDITELKAISALLPEGQNVSVSSTKSMTGHLLGAAGAIEAIACIESIRNNCIPPSINIQNLDPEIPENIHIIQNNAVHRSVNVAMSNVFGFGGHNATIVLGRYK